MPRQPMIVGNPVVLVIDIQKGGFLDGYDGGIPKMADWRPNMGRARQVIDAARASGTPLIFFQEAHRPDMIDFGRELDGTETVHCVEGREGTEIAIEETGYRPGEDYFIRKRRYSCFFGTELEILLKGLKAQTLILIGGLTDVCCHYTFADGHQHDYHCRIVGDAVGGSSDAAHAASLAAMEYLQTGAVRSTQEIVAGLHALRSAA
ncbi:cysteine hydrolase [Albimonas sp. CAU 1670]|uniref:cysteine hydrolase family protein n=1 Tax=Albimonas sp. CAU 1670 TaxID=3032599 RepID=UPI0023DB02FD|nr:isochorismatase family cysteine hydrolase [Albimonas sp. CAU 1670]MDF2235576.1 cysteine hydrolase [Albimonas sp. CAU 1670]